MSQFDLNAKVRTDLGKSASRRLRHTGNVPAILYGDDKEPKILSLSHNDLAKLLENEAFYSSIINLNIDNVSEQVIVKDLQRHPSKPIVMHTDFLRISSTKKLRILLSLHFINEDNCAGVKIGGGNLLHQLNEIEIECFPKDLPEFIKVDVENLELGNALHVSDINLPENVELSNNMNIKTPIISVQKMGSEEEQDTAVDTEKDSTETEEK
jgi:large subunit ribosomal protein L25